MLSSKAQVSLYLVFLMMEMPASRWALVWKREGFFFWSLVNQMLQRVCAMIHTIGSSWSSSSSPRLSSTSCCGVRLGVKGRRHSNSQLVTSVFWGQVSRAWESWSGTAWSHWTQFGVMVFWKPILCNLSWVGMRLCSNFQRKLWSSELRPFIAERLQVTSQSTSGWLISALHGLRDLLPSSSLTMARLFSTSTLYQLPEESVDIFSSPSFFTILMFSNISSGRYGQIGGDGIFLEFSTWYWKRALWYWFVRKFGFIDVSRKDLMSSAIDLYLTLYSPNPPLALGLCKIISSGCSSRLSMPKLIKIIEWALAVKYNIRWGCFDIIGH